MAASRRRWPLEKAVAALEARYGPPRPLPARGAFELILLENVAYLADDPFRELKARVGTSPAALSAAGEDVLREVASAGIMPAGGQAPRLGRNRAPRTPRRPAARPAARPRAGPQGAGALPGDRRAGGREDPAPHPQPPGAGARLEWPARAAALGFGGEKKSYSASYRSAQQAAMADIGKRYDALIRAHRLLRRHGQETCRRPRPRCETCPLAPGCRYFQRGRR